MEETEVVSLTEENGEDFGLNCFEPKRREILKLGPR